MFNNYKKSKTKLPKYREGDMVRPEAAEGTTANYFNTQRNKSKNLGQYAGYAQAAMNLGTQLSANQNLQGDQKNMANANAVNGTVDQVLGSVTPWYGLANTASGLVDSMVKRDAEGRPVDASNQFIATTAKPMHKSLIEDVSKGDYGSAVGDLFGARNIASIGALFAPNNERLRGMASGEESLFAMGGMQPCYNCGGTHQYTNGGISPERKNQEDYLKKYYDELNQNWMASRANLSGKRIGPDVQTPGMKLINQFLFDPRTSKLSDNDYMKISNNLLQGIQNIRKSGEPYRYEDYTNIPEQNFANGGKMTGELTGYSEGGVIHAPEMGGYFRKRS